MQQRGKLFDALFITEAEGLFPGSVPDFSDKNFQRSKGAAHTASLPRSLSLTPSPYTPTPPILGWIPCALFVMSAMFQR